MGANSTQGAAVTIFLLGATAVCTSAFFGGIVMVLLGVALVAVSVVLFQKCKPWENTENGGSR
jgi:hypothetical protein